MSVQLDRYFPLLPPGTRVANLVGGYVIGLAIACLGSNSTIAPEWRLLIVTGFCGGLTTFSTSSAEIVLLLQGRPAWACATAAAHPVGAVVLTFAGMLTYGALRA